MGRGIDPFSSIRSRIQRTSTQVDDTEEAASAQKDDSGTRSSNDLTESQEQMANDLAERMGRELPHGTGRFEPESLINSEESDSTDPLAERLQERTDDPFNGTEHDDRLSRPDLTGPTRPESSYELFDPTTTLTGLVAFDNLGRPGLGGDSESDGFDVPSLFQGATKTGGPGYKTAYDEQEGVVAPKTNGTFAEEYPRLNKLFGQFFGTDNAAGAKTPKGEAIDAALKDIDESSTPTPTPAPAEEPKKDETLLEKAVREAAEEAAAAAAAEAAAAAAEAEKKAGETGTETPPDDFVDPEKAMAFSKYMREQSGYQGTPRDGDIDWGDQPKDSTGGRVIDQSDLYGDRPEGQRGQPELPDGPLAVGNDHAINWGQDAGNPGSGLKEDVPGDVGRPTDLSHLNPENESSDGSRLADRTVRPADGTPTPLSEGARRVAESSTDKIASLSSNQEATSTVRSMSPGGETQTVDLSSGTESNDEGDEDESAAEEPTANDESNTITVSQSPDDDATIVFTPGDGQPTDTVTFESGQEETTDSDNTNTETTASASAGRVLTPVEGRVTASDLRDMQLGRGFFDEAPAPAPAEDTNTDTPRADEQEGDASVLRTGVLPSDLRIPTPLDDLQLQPLRTFEPVGASDDDDGMADDE